MEVLVMAVSAIGGTAAAAAPAAGAAAAGTAASTGLTLLQGAGTVFSAISSFGAAAAKSNELKSAALSDEFQARDEFISGKEEQAKLKQKLLQTVANQQVAFAAGGVDLGSVSVQAAKRQATEDAELELGANSSSAVSRSLARRRSARNKRSRARSTLISGAFGSAGQIIGFGQDVAARG